jgi:4-amino-4-deoxy-L-arabinose transferase-like glycosyltransferase
MLERPAPRKALAAALVALMAALLVLSSLHKRLAYDEYDNLAYGYRVRTLGPLPPLNGQRMPVLVLNALACPAPCKEEDVNATEARLLLVRLPSMLFALGLGVLIYVWAGEATTPVGALLALGLYALHPSFLAHGKEVTSDVAAAFFTVAAAYPLWRIFRGRDPRVHLVLAALATALALASKYTSVLVFPMLALLWLWEVRGRVTRRGLVAAIAFVGLVVFFLNAAYLFQGTLRRADEYNWKSRRMQVLRHVPVPLFLPRTFALGLDFSYLVQEEPDRGRGQNYVLGRLNTDGVFYAFPLMVMLKTPLGFFGLLLLALRARTPDVPSAAWAWLPFALFLVFFSLFVGPQLGIRYLLPGLAFLFLWAARAAGSDRRLVAVLAGWAVVSALSYHPHYMSYFNELIGPRKNAWRFLADSNLDWEDRSYDIARYAAAHPDRPLVFEPETPQAGWVLVGANKLTGVYEPERYRWLRENFRPVDHVGYSYLLFHVSPEELQEALAR